MNEFNRIILQHTSKYGAMTPQDAVKLAYQSACGCGHMICDRQSTYRRLESELICTEIIPCVPLIENIGGGYVRLNLTSPDSRSISARTLNAMFMYTANSVAASTESDCSLEHNIALIDEMCAEGLLGFTYDDFHTYVEKYIAAGMPAVSHSDIYRRLYHPAYRVISERFVRILPVMSRIERLFEQKKRIVVAIDGNSASGKSTAADMLAEIYGANVIHMDDFFLPFNLRTPERLDEAGGNIHYERFISEVIPYLGGNSPYGFGVFSCSVMDTVGRAEIMPKPLTVVEGAYSMHPIYGSPYDIKVFSSAAPNIQRERIIARNGENMYRRFKDIWIPMENKYFSKYDIAQNSDFVI